MASIIPRLRKSLKLSQQLQVHQNFALNFYFLKKHVLIFSRSCSGNLHIGNNFRLVFFRLTSIVEDFGEHVDGAVRRCRSVRKYYGFCVVPQTEWGRNVLGSIPCGRRRSHGFNGRRFSYGQIREKEYSDGHVCPVFYRLAFHHFCSSSRYLF